MIEFSVRGWWYAVDDSGEVYFKGNGKWIYSSPTFSLKHLIERAENNDSFAIEFTTKYRNAKDGQHGRNYSHAVDVF